MTKGENMKKDMKKGPKGSGKKTGAGKPAGARSMPMGKGGSAKSIQKGVKKGGY